VFDGEREKERRNGKERRRGNGKERRLVRASVKEEERRRRRGREGRLRERRKEEEQPSLVGRESGTPPLRVQEPVSAMEELVVAAEDEVETSPVEFRGRDPLPPHRCP
jgi:hypothetical protein